MKTNRLRISKWAGYVLCVCVCIGMTACGDEENVDGAEDTDSGTEVDTNMDSDTGTDTVNDSGTEGETDSSIFPVDVTSPKIMIVGDSISAGPGCYKKYLLQNLQENGFTDFEFVGAYTDDCGGGVMHSAVSCTTTSDYIQETFPKSPYCDLPQDEYPGMAPLVATYNPDLVMIQLGVNDVWGGTAIVQLLLHNFTTLVEQARTHNPNMVFAVAMIHKIITENCTNDASTAKAEEFNQALLAWAEENSTATSPIFIADLWTNSDPENSADCVHPDDTGARQMGLDWYNTLKDILPK